MVKEPNISQKETVKPTQAQSQNKTTPNTATEEKPKTINIEYKNVIKKVNIFKEIKEIIPTPFFPTEKTLYIFLTLFIVIIGIGVFQAMAPVLDISFDPDDTEAELFELEISVGWPMQFFGTTEESKKVITMEWTGLLVDLMTILVLSYVLEFLLNFLLSIKLGPSKEQQRQKPKTFQFQKKSLTEKATEKIAEKTTPKAQKPNTQPSKVSPAQPQKPNTQPQKVTQ